MDQNNTPISLQTIIDEQHPTTQMRLIGSMVTGLETEIQSITSSKQMGKVQTKIRNLTKDLKVMLEISEEVYPLEPSDEYLKIVEFLKVVTNEEELRVYLGKYEALATSLERLKVSANAFAEFMNLEYISEDIKKRFSKLFDVLLEWLPTNTNHSNWYELLLAEIEKQRTPEEKVILIKSVLKEIGNKLTELFTTSNFHPHFADPVLNRGDAPVKEHVELAQNKLARNFSTNYKIIPADSYGIFYGTNDARSGREVNLGLNLFCNFDKFVASLKSMHKEIEPSLVTLTNGQRAYNSVKPHATQLDFQFIDEDLNTVSPGISFNKKDDGSGEIEYKEARMVRIIYAMNYFLDPNDSKTKGKFNFSDVILISAFPVIPNKPVLS